MVLSPVSQGCCKNKLRVVYLLPVLVPMVLFEKMCRDMWNLSTLPYLPMEKESLLTNSLDIIF